MSESYHIPVMAPEALEYLDVRPDGLYMDCTLGGGGHSKAILDAGGKVVAVDRDPQAVAFATERLAPYGSRFSAHKARFSRIREIAGPDAGSFDGVLMDLGLSSKMIDDPTKGFSYRQNGPLLMDMGGAEETAADVVNRLDFRELARIFREYGEEKHASRIAREIVNVRASRPISTTGEISDLIERVVGPRMPQKSKARIFQALRIYVNRELEELQEGLEGALEILKTGGRLCVISYHSLEDRMVKTFMRDKANPCICPRDLPICRCGRIPELHVLTRKPVTASPEEIAVNERSRSALLRAAEKVA
ncbi:MAG: 16S rRNA (cytosine(1402)-N(4))-methyltransferase RsmH [Candidatus Latescibacterota bacterium]